MGTYDLTGRSFCKLTVLERAPKRADLVSRGARWICLCECGQQVEADGAALKNGAIRSCGCLRSETMREKNDLSGQVFGRLEVLSLVTQQPPESKERSLRWLCRCVCGQEVEVIAKSLRSGATRSCGCLQRDRATEVHTKHGAYANPLVPRVPKRKRQVRPDTLGNKEWLEAEYLVKEKSAKQISVDLDCSVSVVLTNLRRHGIEVRDSSAAQILSQEQHPRAGSSVPRPRSKFLGTLHNETWLRTRYLEWKWTATHIARETGASVPSAIYAIKKYCGVDKARRPSPRSDERLATQRARRLTHQLFPGDEPCKICNSLEESQRNHINADIHDNRPENIERLCRMHHLMVDKRLDARARKYVSKELRPMWLEWHEEVLAEVATQMTPVPRDKR